MPKRRRGRGGYRGGVNGPGSGSGRSGSGGGSGGGGGGGDVLDKRMGYDERMRNRRRGYEEPGPTKSKSLSESDEKIAVVRERLVEHVQATGGPRHPSHLRGKEIGLWYSQQSRALKHELRNKEIVQLKTMGKVIIPMGRAKQIRSFLEKQPPCQQLQRQSRGGMNYDHVPNSKFKRNFLDVITNIRKHENYKPLERQPALDTQLRREFEESSMSIHYMKMRRVRERLPAYKMRQKIIDTISNNQIVVVSGATGCGKTTQIPQFLLEDCLLRNRGSLCRIICSQPRRISAIAVAERIADERAEPLGISVGYQIRLQCKLPRPRASVTFCTTGIILKLMEGNMSLEGVSHLILDEVHERDVLTDILITLLRQLVRKRPDLKVILMSATLNAEKFANYFSLKSFISIPGFTYDVKEYYLEDALLRTGFKFSEDVCQMFGVRRFYSNWGEQKEREQAFFDLIMPHVSRMEQLQLYPKSVCRELVKEISEENTIDLAVALVDDICRKEDDNGAILVFLTGYGDISKMHQTMEESGNFPKSNFLVIPLHSQMQTSQQKIIFASPPRGIRKIILSTNIAETSITIDDVVYVIDCGKTKINDFNADSNVDTLSPQWVSKASADQRRGRAGRVRPGVCYHLFSQARNAALEPQQKPELLRKRLDDVILMVKLLKLGSAVDFLSTCPDPPDLDNIEQSIQFLKRLNALDDNEVLTPLGYHLARLPVAPQIGKMMLLGSLFSCINPIINIASALDFKDAFLMPLGKEDLCRRRKKELAEGYKSDHFLFHLTMDKYESIQDKKQFCKDYFLSPQTMTQLSKMKLQFVEILRDLNFLKSADPKAECENQNSNNISLIKAIICASLYPNVFINHSRMSSRQTYSKFFTMDNKKLDIHPKSILMRNERFDSPFLVYYRRVHSTSDFIHDASVVHTLPLIFFGDKFKVLRDSNEINLAINNTLKWKTNEDTSKVIVELRTRLNHFLEMKACQPASVDWQKEEEVGILKAIIRLITIEDEGYDVDDFD